MDTEPKPCSCPVAGWCARHKLEKTEVARQRCISKPHYRKAWDEGRLHGQRIDGLGDFIERVLGPVGRAYRRWRRGKCGCAHRKAKLNQAIHKARKSQ